MSMMPNTSVRPAASRNSISPNCRPLSDCSRIRIEDMGPIKRAGPRPRPSSGHRLSLLHPAILDIGVAMVLEDGRERLVDDPPLRILADHAQVVVLDRVLVGVQ